MTRTETNTMIKALILFVIVFFSAIVSAPPALAAEELNVLTWCDHTDPRLLQAFEKKHKVRINMKEYDGTGVALALLEQSQPGDWDVFVVDSIDVKRVVNLGLLAPLNRKDFPWNDIFPEVRTPELNSVGGIFYAMPEKFGYNTIAYNNKKVDPADMRDAAVLWNPKYKGRIAVYDYYIPVIEMVAIGLGIKPTELNKSHLPAIKEKLFKMKELSALVGDVVQVQTALATGEVDIIAGGGEFAVSVLHNENPALDWVLPNQGGVRWQQAIGVFAASKKKDLAVEFLQYILSPEGQGRLATSSCYWAMPANSKAALTPEQKKILRWDEQPKFLANSYFYLQPDEAFDKAMLDVWTEFLQH
ncbi:ABC transporter, substrate-binding protein (cluster 1, maltose/g3p/polyamine/iron) [Olavius sp. associated proteobacterium Delta 1]|nr:ABC transporter, substrate-binding protein (cluster 1, maltose/g3p/polyamine/iron) [Olavius sp. associated proteobacterium Delta 1]